MVPKVLLRTGPSLRSGWGFSTITKSFGTSEVSSLLSPLKLGILAPNLDSAKEMAAFMASLRASGLFPIAEALSGFPPPIIISKILNQELVYQTSFKNYIIIN